MFIIFGNGFKTYIEAKGKFNYHDLKVHGVGHYGRSQEMPVNIGLDKNITFHLTWELEDFKKNMNSWRLPAILDHLWC